MRASASAAFLSLVFATTVAAQGRAGGISGVVEDSLGLPIPNVEITAILAAKSVRSDSVGHFLLAGLPAGNVSVSFRRLSYAPVILTIAVAAADTEEVKVTLGVVAQ